MSKILQKSGNDVIEFYYNSNITSSLIQVVLEILEKSLGNSDMDFPTSGPWLPGCTCTWFFIAAFVYMLVVSAYIHSCTYKFHAASLFMLVVLAFG